MRDLNDLYYFAQVVERGGFARAARALGVPTSRLSRRIAALEARLGSRLMHRTTRKLSLTDAGRDVYAHCRTVVAAAEAAEQAAVHHSAEPRGQLRVACPLAIAQYELGPILGAFMRRHPLVRLDLHVTNRRVDLIEEGIDVALRARVPGDEDPNLATRKLRQSRRAVLAAPALLKEVGRIETPDDLQRVPVLDFGTSAESTVWRLSGPNSETRRISVPARMHADDFVVLKWAALDGLGACLLPPHYCTEELARGRLVHLLPQWSAPAEIVHVVYPSARLLAPAVRAFVDFVAEHLARPVGAPRRR